MSSLLLEDDGPSMDPMHADSIRMINTSGELLSAVVDDVLDYAKLESGSFEVDIGLTKLQDTLDSVLYSITQKMQEKNIRIRTHFSPTVPEIIETDSRRLQQVLFNLLGNAGKFSKIDSVIDLSVSLVKATSTNGTNGDNERRDIIRFSVKDYGKGIDKKDFETIFQPFSQASKETQNVYGGTGLGLSITSKLVHRLGGKISLDSELGKFADFTFDLPMNGKYVDIQKISDCLKNATIILIEPKQVYDYSFTPFPIREESLPLGPAVIEVFGLNIIRCNTLKELNGKISARNDNRLHEHFTLLVHETLHELCSSEQLDSILGQPKCYSLMTYGKNFLAEKTNACHFKSLTGLFPATLLEAITKQISTHKQMETISGPTSSKFATILQTPVTSNAKKFISKDGLSASHLTSKEKMTSALAKTTKNPGNITKVSIGKLDLKILYAEDNIVNQKVLARVLNRYGITDITIVDNGKKAVDISAKTKYDCILLDMQMPIMGGIEACELIMDRDPDSKIVFVTAHALDEFKVKAKSVGAIGFISKPFRVGDIDEVLKEIYM
ncbi:MAG: CheY-like chemotaxis protein [Bacillariaceae sp.]|jgi:CheY-like chemotaxis protein